MATFLLVIMEQKQFNLFLEVVNKSVPRDTVVVEGAGVVGGHSCGRGADGGGALL